MPKYHDLAMPLSSTLQTFQEHTVYFVVVVYFQVKAVYIHSEMFSVQNGLLTPTLKARRPELREYFKKQIEELYSSISI